MTLHLELICSVNTVSSQSIFHDHAYISKSLAVQYDKNTFVQPRIVHVNTPEVKSHGEFADTVLYSVDARDLLRSPYAWAVTDDRRVHNIVKIYEYFVRHPYERFVFADWKSQSLCGRVRYIFSSYIVVQVFCLYKS